MPLDRPYGQEQLVGDVLLLVAKVGRFLGIDGIANGAGYASRAFGWVGSRLQTGQINTYAFAIVAGTLLLLAFVIL